MGSECFSQPSATISINSINRLVFVMEQKYVLSEVGTELLYYSDEFETCNWSYHGSAGKLLCTRRPDSTPVSPYEICGLRQRNEERFYQVLRSSSHYIIPPHDLYSSSFMCCFHQKDKRNKPGNLRKINAF